MGNTTLKEQFPRLFSVSVQQNAFIDEHGFWDGAKWQWNLLWRRELFGWEAELIPELLSLLEHEVICRIRLDKWIWSYHASGVFNTKSFVDAVVELKNGELFAHNFAARVWCKVAPPKVELLAWFVILGKLNSKDRLARLNITSNGDTLCVLCNEQKESIEHFFFFFFT